MDDVAKVLFTIGPLAIPILAIVGGITLAIVRTIGQQRLAELERRERIAAIERGIDPANLPPVSTPGAYENGHGWGSRTRRAHGLLIGGLVTIAVGLSMMVFLRGVEPGHDHWLIGLMPTLVGVALLVSARVVWPSDSK